MTDDASITDVILLVHGIRDYGRWTTKAAALFKDTERLKIFPVKYGYFDAITFLAPKNSSDVPYKKLVALYESAVENVPNARVSIIAHSHGTFLVGRLLDEFMCPALYRVILCGSVLPRNYDWDNVRVRFSAPDKFCLNECGASDPWPLQAEAARKRYGASGRHGFENSVLVTNQWYLGGHDLFFRRQHMVNWLPFIREGRLPRENGVQPEPLLIERIFATFPFTPFLWRACVTIGWATVRFWYLWALAAFLTVAMLIYLYVRSGPNYYSITLSPVLQEVSAKASGFDAEKWKRYVSTNFLSDYSRDVAFDAIVVKVAPSQAEDAGSTRTLFLCAEGDCAALTDPNTFVVALTIAESDLPTDPTNLEPKVKITNGTSHIGYPKVRVKGRFENVVRYGDHGGKLFMKGDSLGYSGEHQDCPVLK